MSAEPSTRIAELEAECERVNRMFMDACEDLGAICEALSLNPDDGGAEPILAAIEELRSTPPQQVVGEAVAQICGTWELRWIGAGPISPIVEKHGLKIGDYLYAAPLEKGDISAIRVAAEAVLHHFRKDATEFWERFPSTFKVLAQGKLDALKLAISTHPAPPAPVQQKDSEKIGGGNV